MFRIMLAFILSGCSPALATGYKSWASSQTYYSGTMDPTAGVNAPMGTLFFRNTGGIYIKTDNNYSTNWSLMNSGSTTSQSANRIFAGPASGSAAIPTFRALVFADIPGITASTASTIVARDANGNSQFGALQMGLASGGGGFNNVGIGSAPSTSVNYLVLSQRSQVGLSNWQLSNPDTGAGSGTKIQMAVDAAGNGGELGLFTAATVAPNAYAGGNMTIRSTGATAGLSFIADDSGTYQKFYVAGNASTNMVQELTATKAIFNNVHLDSTTNGTVTATVKAGAGTSATCAVTHATDSAGIISLTTTAASPASGAQCDINFVTAYGVAPLCVIQPVSALTASLVVSSQIYLTSTTGKVTVNFGATDAAGHAYTWNYSCIETQ